MNDMELNSLINMHSKVVKIDSLPLSIYGKRFALISNDNENGSN